MRGAVEMVRIGSRTPPLSTGAHEFIASANLLRAFCFVHSSFKLSFCVVVFVSQDSVGLSPYKNIVYISLTFVSFIYLLFAANTCSEHARTAAYFIIESIY